MGLPNRYSTETIRWVSLVIGYCTIAKAVYNRSESRSEKRNVLISSLIEYIEFGLCVFDTGLSSFSSETLLLTKMD